MRNLVNSLLLLSLLQSHSSLWAKTQSDEFGDEDEPASGHSMPAKSRAAGAPVEVTRPVSSDSIQSEDDEDEETQATPATQPTRALETPQDRPLPQNDAPAQAPAAVQKTPTREAAPRAVQRQVPAQAPQASSQVAAPQAAPTAQTAAPAPQSAAAATQSPSLQTPTQAAPAAQTTEAPAQPAPSAPKPQVAPKAPAAVQTRPQTPVARPVPVPQPSVTAEPASGMRDPYGESDELKKTPVRGKVKPSDIGLTVQQNNAISEIRKQHAQQPDEKRITEELKQARAALNQAMIDATPALEVRRRFELVQSKYLELQRIKFERTLKIRDVLTVEQRKKLQTIRNSH